MTECEERATRVAQPTEHAQRRSVGEGLMPRTRYGASNIKMSSMEPRDLPRRQLIDELMAQHPEQIADTAIDLWERMTAQIVSIVGEDGFNALYVRSVFLAQPTFPWLADCALPHHRHQRFAELRKGIEAQTSSHAREANSLLLLTFTGILVTLIGEPLTTRILRTAWGDDALYSASKEFTHE